ncbi:TIGR04206 family protein [Natronoarchaeum mannanilyticum]|uniref:DUF8050 domain-containing protein n=1 Tax=Natronoarchaeum mannanilyticum TaxID=926360 RepID=A0AAV3TA96_9EURY
MTDADVEAYDDEAYDGADEAHDIDTGDADPRRRRRFLALLLAGLAPWVVLIAPSGRDVFFAWGWINVEGWHVFHLYEYLFEFTRGPRALPRRLQAWPIATALYAGALVSALGGLVFGREDRRVTGGLAVFAMLSLLQFAAGFTRPGIARPGVTPLPVGVVAVLVVLWWFDGDLLGL